MERGRGGRETEGKRGQERERERERKRERRGAAQWPVVSVGLMWAGWCCRSCRGWSLQYTLAAEAHMCFWVFADRNLLS